MAQPLLFPLHEESLRLTKAPDVKLVADFGIPGEYAKEAFRTYFPELDHYCEENGISAMLHRRIKTIRDLRAALAEHLWQERLQIVTVDYMESTWRTKSHGEVLENRPVLFVTEFMDWFEAFAIPTRRPNIYAVFTGSAISTSGVKEQWKHPYIHTLTIEELDHAFYNAEQSKSPGM